MISILDYGMGNLASIRNMFKKIGASSTIIKTPEEISHAAALVIPGVGKFDNALKNIDEMGVRDSLEEAANVRQIPILGICLGMQLMTRASEEGVLPGLGWIQADCRLIDGQKYDVRVPHMGWNVVKIEKKSPYFEETDTKQRFYFVHSYAVHCDNKDHILTTTPYAGGVVSSFSVRNFLGVQFHPEKSHKFGAGLLHKFVTTHKLNNIGNNHFEE